LSPAEAIYQREVARTIVAVYNELKYQIYNVGGNDLLFGVDFINTLQKEANFAFISANLQDSTTAKLIFVPYKIFPCGSKRIAVIGVTSQWGKPQRNLLCVQPAKALQKYLPELQRKADYIVVLGALTTEDENSVVAIKESFDFLLTAGAYRYSRNLETDHQKYVARVGTIGKYLGIITAIRNTPAQPLQDISSINSQLDYTTNRLNAFRENAGGKDLDDFYADKPTLLKVVHDLQSYEKELRQKQTAIVNPLNFELLPLDEKIKDDVAVRAKINELYQKHGKPIKTENQ